MRFEDCEVDGWRMGSNITSIISLTDIRLGEMRKRALAATERAKSLMPTYLKL